MARDSWRVSIRKSCGAPAHSSDRSLIRVTENLASRYGWPGGVGHGVADRQTFRAERNPDARITQHQELKAELALSNLAAKAGNFFCCGFHPSLDLYKPAARNTRIAS